MRFLTYRCVRILVGQFDFSLLNNILRRDQIGGCIYLTVFSSNYTMKVRTVQYVYFHCPFDNLNSAVLQM